MDHLSKDKMDAMTTNEKREFVANKIMEMLTHPIMGDNAIAQLEIHQKIFLFGNLEGVLTVASKIAEDGEKEYAEKIKEEYKDFFSAFICEMCGGKSKNFIEFLYEIQDYSWAFKCLVHRYITWHNKLCPEYEFEITSVNPEEYEKRREDLENKKGDENQD